MTGALTPNEEMVMKEAFRATMLRAAAIKVTN